MQQSLEKRVSALEKVSSVADTVLLIIFAGMGESGMELVHIYDSHGNNWNRRPEETEEAFQHRAASETSRNENGVTTLFGNVADVGHWRDSEAN